MVTSEGKYLEIGKETTDGSSFKWLFKKEKYLFGFKLGVEEYVTFINPIYLESQMLKLKAKQSKIDIVNACEENAQTIKPGKLIA